MPIEKDRIDRLKGVRYIRFVRCSTMGQADTSIDDQLVLLDAFAREHEMVHVDDLIIEGISASMPRRFFDQLIERKRRRNDFDVLLVQNTSRMTRSGSKYGARIESELEDAGIEVVFALDDSPAGDYGDLIRNIKYNADRETAKKISAGTTRGAQSALEQGRAAPVRRPPYGIDRLYTAPDGTLKYVLRNVPDGSQLKLDPQTAAIAERFPPNRGGKGYNHHRKQKDERIVLVPGEAQAIAVVRRIYDIYFTEDKGTHLIAKTLNDDGIPGPSGKLWNEQTVMAILQNPLYTGRSIANRTTTGIFHMRNPSSPTPVHRTPSQLAGRSKPAMRVRPREEWRIQDEPQLKDFLEPHIRALAVAFQDRYFDAQAGGYMPTPNRDRHRESPYILKGILTSKPGGFPMTGSNRGRKGHARRYYAVGQAQRCPRTVDSVLRKAHLAAPLETLALNAVRLTLLAAPNLKNKLKRELERELAAEKSGGNDVAHLHADLKEVKTQMEFIIKNCAVIGEDEAATRLAACAERRDGIQRQLRLLESSTPIATDGVDKLVDAVVVGLQKTGEQMRHSCLAALRRLLQTLIAKAELDLATGHLDLELRLPRWAMTDPAKLCFDPPFAYKTSDEAQRRKGLLLMRFRMLRLRNQYVGYGVAI